MCDPCVLTANALYVAAGIGRGDGDLGQLAKMASRPDAAQRWRRAKVLVVDEVSLLVLAGPQSSQIAKNEPSCTPFDPQCYFPSPLYPLLHLPMLTYGTYLVPHC